MNKCKIKGCENPSQLRRGWCVLHYKRWQRHGDPLGGRMPNGTSSKFLHEVAFNFRKNTCLKWPFITRADGHAQLWIKGKTIIAARLVCEHFHGPPPTPQHEAAHLCGKGHLGCVNGKHLRWKTHSENEADKLVHDTHTRGERNGVAKLTEHDVKRIKKLKGKKSHNEIAKEFNVHRVTVTSILLGRSWTWLN